MFDYRGLHDALFLMLYIGAGVLAMLAALYLLLRRRNLFMREYLSQLLTVTIVAFLVWRAETLQELSDGGPPG